MMIEKEEISHTDIKELRSFISELGQEVAPKTFGLRIPNALRTYRTWSVVGPAKYAYCMYKGFTK